MFTEPKRYLHTAKAMFMLLLNKLLALSLCLTQTNILITSAMVFETSYNHSPYRPNMLRNTARTTRRTGATRLTQRVDIARRNKILRRMAESDTILASVVNDATIGELMLDQLAYGLRPLPLHSWDMETLITDPSRCSKQMRQEIILMRNAPTITESEYANLVKSNGEVPICTICLETIQPPPFKPLSPWDERADDAAVKLVAVEGSFPTGPVSILDSPVPTLDAFVPLLKSFSPLYDDYMATRNTVKMRPCNPSVPHNFHLGCIRLWFFSDKTAEINHCPTCRTDLYKRQGGGRVWEWNFVMDQTTGEYRERSYRDSYNGESGLDADSGYDYYSAYGSEVGMPEEVEREEDPEHLNDEVEENEQGFSNPCIQNVAQLPPSNSAAQTCRCADCEELRNKPPTSTNLTILPMQLYEHKAMVTVARSWPETSTTKDSTEWGKPIVKLIHKESVASELRRRLLVAMEMPRCGWEVIVSKKIERWCGTYLDTCASLNVRKITPVLSARIQTPHLLWRFLLPAWQLDGLRARKSLNCEW